MAFGNPIVGGDDGELIRNAMHSRGFVSGSTGWEIRADGTAEFNNVTVRGDFIIGTPPSPPNAYIQGTVIAGVPGIYVYDGVNSTPSFLKSGSGLGPSRISMGTPTSTIDLGSTFAILDVNSFGDEPQITMDDSGIAGAPKISLIPQLAETFGLYMHTADRWAELGFLAAQNAAVIGLADGKRGTGTTDTTIGTTNTLITSANAANVPQIINHAYIAFIQMNFRNNNVGGRLGWRLWDGTVGTTQLGNASIRFSRVATATNFDGDFLFFMWRASSTQTISSLNLSCAKEVVTAGAAVARFEAPYIFAIMDLGPADRISNL